ncbi:MAG: helix-turn-helix transcriptional regulator [Eubacterium sp.]
MFNKIKEIRKDNGLTQSDFGKSLGVSRFTIANIESNRAVPTDTFVQLLCIKYKINENWLRSGTGDKKPIENDVSISDLKEKYRLSPIDVKIIKGYLQLTPEQRKVFHVYFKNVENIALTDDEEIRIELESYENELRQEKRTKTSEVSQNTGDTEKTG